MITRAFILMIAPCLCLPFPAVADQTAGPGVQVGAAAPDFKLKDQTGAERSRDQLSQGAEYLALVFYRSAGW